MCKKNLHFNTGYPMTFDNLQNVKNTGSDTVMFVDIVHCIFLCQGLKASAVLQFQEKCTVTE
jgi:hypothetical protein